MTIELREPQPIEKSYTRTINLTKKQHVMLTPKQKYKRSNSIARNLMRKRNLSNNELEKMGLDLSCAVIYEATEIHKPRVLRRFSVLLRHFDAWNGKSMIARSLIDASRLRGNMGKNFVGYQVVFSY